MQSYVATEHARHGQANTISKMLDTLERLVMIIVKFVNNQDKLKTIILYYKSGLVNALERVFMTSTYIIW